MYNMSWEEQQALARCQAKAQTVATTLELATTVEALHLALDDLGFKRRRFECATEGGSAFVDEWRMDVDQYTVRVSPSFGVVQAIDRHRMWTQVQILLSPWTRRRLLSV